MIYLLIGVGAFFGAISRFLLSSYLAKIIFLGFPLGTLIINLIGCFLIGIFLAINFSNKEIISPLIIIGFLGSFTTFSAFTKEVLLFSTANGIFVAYLTALIITSICLLSTFIGYKIFS
jgi:CrcB protein